MNTKKLYVSLLQVSISCRLCMAAIIFRHVRTQTAREKKRLCVQTRARRRGCGRLFREYFQLENGCAIRFETHNQNITGEVYTQKEVFLFKSRLLQSVHSGRPGKSDPLESNITTDMVMYGVLRFPELICMPSRSMISSFLRRLS